MNALREYLGFKIAFAEPTDGDLWGEKVSPGNFSGLSGDITKNKTDIGFAVIFIKLENMKYMDYTYPYMTEWVCYMVSNEHTKSTTIIFHLYLIGIKTGQSTQ